MGWSIGYDDNWKRDIGYGVPCICDHPDCDEKIDRGLAHVCGGDPYGGDEGCGLFFCAKHLYFGKGESQKCDKCFDGEKPFDPKADTQEWIDWKLTDESWQQWRDENPEEVKALNQPLIEE